MFYSLTSSQHFTTWPSLRRNIVGLHTKIKNTIMAVINIILGRADNYEVGYDNFIDQGYQLTLPYVLLGILRLWAIFKGCDNYLWLGYPKGVISGYEWDILSVKWLWGLSVKHHQPHVETIIVITEDQRIESQMVYDYCIYANVKFDYEMGTFVPRFFSVSCPCRAVSLIYTPFLI